MNWNKIVGYLVEATRSSFEDYRSSLPAGWTCSERDDSRKHPALKAGHCCDGRAEIEVRYPSDAEAQTHAPRRNCRHRLRMAHVARA